jgi:hypothetical protein
MKRTDENLVKSVINLQEDLNSLTQDKIREQAPKADIEPQMKLSLKDKAKMEGAKYVEPKRKLAAIGKLPENMKKAHAHDWEYVKGIYENYVVTGESVNFWYVKYPGDPDCEWEVPANKPVYIPRMIAKHLEEVQQYHTFDHREKSPDQQQKLDYVENFCVTGTKYRGKFRPIGAFA